MLRARLAWTIALAAVLAAPAGASAATPLDGRFAGRTSQDAKGGKPARMSFRIARTGKVIEDISFASVASCPGRAKLRITALVVAPVRLVVGPRIKLGGTLRGSLRRGSTYRASFTMDGGFPTRGRASGIWTLRANVRNRQGKITARCRTRRVEWRATRL